ncbi:MAG: hypothetical protein H7210_14130 [Pyrinomonadaceae bacterium]|nr:hypothetical protein [Phycisphaerales bacterium]
MNPIARLSALCSVALVASLSQAHTIEYRIVERIGNTDHVLPSNTIRVRPGSAHRFRVQCRVIPSGPSDVRAGILGWNTGTIVTTGGINTRTGQSPNPSPRGRIPPFTFAQGPGSEGFPAIDPFTSLDLIDAVVGIRTAEWVCGGDGLPTSQPEPAPYGRGDFVSTYEFTSVATPATYTITIAGQMIAGSHYLPVNCSPPDCGDPGTPDDDVTTNCIFGVIATTPEPFSMQLTIEPLCGEWNNDYVVNSQDIFDFFQSFFSGDADVDGDGLTNSNDYFAYIIGFVRGCR